MPIALVDKMVMLGIMASAFALTKHVKGMASVGTIACAIVLNRLSVCAIEKIAKTKVGLSE